ncbi:hypothetical protein ACWD4G_14840 [Streptomyces sp. NPDC002643]
MRRLSARLVAGLARTAPRDGDDGVFDPLCRVVSGLRGRPVVLRWTRFPPNTASGVWVELAEMDLLAIRDDAADVEHALVIWGHEVWHMMEGHRGALTLAGPASARSRSIRGDAVERAVESLSAVEGTLDALSAVEGTADVLSAASEAGWAAGAIAYAGRTDFHAEQEAEAERFGLEFATAMRGYLRRPDLLKVSGRIEKSLGQGPWA